MRYALAAVALVIAGSAQAQEASSDARNAAAAASRMAAIRSACPETIPTDKVQASKYIDLYGEAGINFVGVQVWSRLIKEQVARRIREIEATGPQRWCEDQRRYLREIGETKVFP